jgi:hypothetical protein
LAGRSVDTYERARNGELCSSQRGKSHTLNETFLVLVRKFFQGLALGFGEKKGREDPCQHEEGIYFEARKSRHQKRTLRG